MSSPVAIKLDPGPFYGGKYLSGTISITVKGVPLTFSYLVVQVYVASTVCIHRNDFFSPIGKNYEKYDINCEPIEKRHHQQIYINNHTVFDQLSTFNHGTYTFRFKTKLPEDLPPNAYDQVTNLSFGRIDFTATAKFGVVTGNKSGSEINATAAFEYIPHVYVGDPDDSFDYTQEVYFPFPDQMVDGEDEHEHPHSLPKPTMGEMRELLKNEPKGKLRIMCKEPWFQMQQDRGNSYELFFEQPQSSSPLWVEVSQLHMQEAVTLIVDNFKIVHWANKCAVPHPGVWLQGKYVRVRLESIKPSVPLVPSFYSLNYRHTYRLRMRVKISRQFMGKTEVYDDFNLSTVDVLSPYVTQRKHMMDTLGKRPVIMRPIFHQYFHNSERMNQGNLKSICICEVESRFLTNEPQITHTWQQSPGYE